MTGRAARRQDSPARRLSSGHDHNPGTTTNEFHIA